MNPIALPILLPLLGAGLVALSSRRLQARALGLAGSALSTAASFWLAATVLRSGTIRTTLGGWDDGTGISLVADPLAVLILAVASLVVLASHVHAVLTPSIEQDWRHYHAVHLVLAAGVALSLLTGDLFTLFVGFEMSLVASYVLLAGRRRIQPLRAASTYIITNIVVSTLFLIAVAGVYAAAGTLDMAALSTIWPELDATVRGALGLALLVVFAAKAAAFPLFGWLPDAYATASPPVAALLAGLLTKLGVYALVRMETLIGLTPAELPWLLPLIAAATMLIGVVAALAQTEVRRILSFHIVSQIGYMLVGLSIATELALAGTVFYVVHHILVKSALFLVAGLMEQRAGSGRLEDLGGLARSAPWLAAAFAVPALSLAGIPPLSGFTAKVAIFQAGIDDTQVWLVAAAAVAGILTVLSMAKIWSGAFWGDIPPARDDLVAGGWSGSYAADGGAAAPRHSAAGARLALGPAMLIVGTLVVSLSAGPILGWSDTAAGQLDAAAYVGGA